MKRTFNVLTSERAIILAAVGVDIGCGVMAVETDLNARFLPDNRKGIRRATLWKSFTHCPKSSVLRGN
jgi:tRNA-splicing ligase RtcB